MKKRVLTGTLAAMMCVTMMTGTVNAGERRESDGYNSAVETAQAYIDALALHDVDGMIKTYAIETYVDRYNLSAQVDRMQLWNVALEIPIPVIDDYTRELATIKREGAIANALTQQYAFYAVEAAGNTFDGAPIMLGTTEYENGEDFVEHYFYDPIWLQENITDVEICTAEEYAATIEGFPEDNYKPMLEKIGVGVGTDELQEMVIKFTAGEKQYCQFLQTGCYDGKWYNIGTVPIITSILGLDVTATGLMEAE